LYTFVAWCALGAVITIGMIVNLDGRGPLLTMKKTLVLFVCLLVKPLGVFAVFMIVLIFAISFNIKFFTDNILEDTFVTDPTAVDVLLGGELPSYAAASQPNPPS
jgi:hypothetical protein